MAFDYSYLRLNRRVIDYFYSHYDVPSVTEEELISGYSRKSMVFILGQFFGIKPFNSYSKTRIARAFYSELRLWSYIVGKFSMPELKNIIGVANA